MLLYVFLNKFRIPTDVMLTSWLSTEFNWVEKLGTVVFEPGGMQPMLDTRWVGKVLGTDLSSL